MSLSDLPEQLTDDRKYRWVVFRLHYSPDKQKPDKVPYQINGTKARINDKSTWSNFRSCMNAISLCVGHLPGIAVTSDSNICAIDIDHCIDADGNINDLAKKYIDKFKGKAYIERSVSKTGVHILFWYTGTKPSVHPENGIELYTDDRFIAITGDIIG